MDPTCKHEPGIQNQNQWNILISWWMGVCDEGISWEVLGWWKQRAKNQWGWKDWTWQKSWSRATDWSQRAELKTKQKKTEFGHNITTWETLDLAESGWLSWFLYTVQMMRWFVAGVVVNWQVWENWKPMPSSTHRQAETDKMNMTYRKTIRKTLDWERKRQSCIPNL